MEAAKSRIRVNQTLRNLISPKSSITREENEQTIVSIFIIICFIFISLLFYIPISLFIIVLKECQRFESESKKLLKNQSAKSWLISQVLP
jgi:hypothetical protein